MEIFGYILMFVGVIALLIWAFFDNEKLIEKARPYKRGEKYEPLKHKTYLLIGSAGYVLLGAALIYGFIKYLMNL